jgi:hypothetical protein
MLWWSGTAYRMHRDPSHASGAQTADRSKCLLKSSRNNRVRRAQVIDRVGVYAFWARRELGLVAALRRDSLDGQASSRFHPDRIRTATGRPTP